MQVARWLRNGGKRLRPGIVALAMAAAAEAAPPAIRNGDFESPDEGGWTYLGQGDGSHGVFSDPTRPGSHSYLLQLAGTSSDEFGAISQILSLTRGAVYRVQLDVWDRCPVPSPDADCRQSAVLGEATVFDRQPGGPPGTGSGDWTRFTALYRAEREHPVLQFRLAGHGTDREASTTAVDEVLVEPVDVLLPPPLLPGKPLIAAKDQGPVPLACGYGGVQPSLLSLQELRDLLGTTPALAAVRHRWRDAAASTPALWPGLSAWALHGVLPIVSIPCSPTDLAEFQSGKTLPRWRQFAAEARRWRYPLILRLAPGMDLHFPASHAPAFQAFWNSLHATFREADARNVLWFWSPSRLGEASDPFYPGNASVDLVGFTLGEPDGRAALRLNAEFARKQYPGKGIAVAGCTGPLPAPEEWRRLCPDLEFFTAGDLAAPLPAAKSPAAAELAKTLRHPAVLPTYSQIHPPSIQVRIFRDGTRITVVLHNRDRPRAASPTAVRVAAWKGIPFEDGALLKDFGSITVRPGHRRTLRTALPAGAVLQAKVLVDRTAAPCFQHPLPGDVDWENDPDLMLFPVPQ